MLIPWSQSCSLQNWEKINVCCLSHSVGVTWLWQPKLTISETGLHYSWHNKQHELHVHIGSPCSSSPTGITQSRSGRSTRALGLCHIWEALSLGNPNLFKWTISLPDPCPEGKKSFILEHGKRRTLLQREALCLPLFKHSRRDSPEHRQPVPGFMRSWFQDTMENCLQAGLVFFFFFKFV